MCSDVVLVSHPLVVVDATVPEDRVVRVDQEHKAAPWVGDIRVIGEHAGAEGREAILR